MSLSAKKILITAGPTRAPLDAIRYLTNRGTGRLGALLAEKALRRNAQVTFVHGRPSHLPLARGRVRNNLWLIAVDTVEDLVETFREELPKEYDALIHPMAVLDFAPVEAREGKVSSEVREWVISLVPTPKAIQLVKDLAPKTFLIGFKLEVGRTPEDLVRIAFEFRRKTRAEVIMANDYRDIEAGRHRGYIVDDREELLAVPEGKEAIARTLIDLLDKRLH